MQWGIHHAFRAFLKLASALRLIRVTLRGADRLAGAGACVIVANHPTLLDVVLLVALLPQADCVIKASAWRNPYFRRIVRAAGYVPNSDGPELLAACVARIQNGRRLLLFPEGTRSPRDGGIAGFHRGAARIALASGCDIVPVVIRCDPPTLGKGERWFHVPDRVISLTVEVETAVRPLRRPGETARGALASREITNELQHFYRRRLSDVTS